MSYNTKTFLLGMGACVLAGIVLSVPLYLIDASDSVFVLSGVIVGFIAMQLVLNKRGFKIEK